MDAIKIWHVPRIGSCILVCLFTITTWFGWSAPTWGQSPGRRNVALRETAADLYRNGNRLFAKGAYSAAASQYERATQLCPSDKLLWERMGVCYVKTKRLADAERAVKTALKIRYSYATEFNLAVVYAEQKRWREAKEISDRLAKRELGPELHARAEKFSVYLSEDMAKAKHP